MLRDLTASGLVRMLPQIEGGYLTPWYLLQPLEGMRGVEDFTFAPGQWAYHPFAILLRRRGIAPFDLLGWQHRAHVGSGFGGPWWLELWDSFERTLLESGFDRLEFSYVGNLISLAPVGLPLLPPGPGAAPVPRPGAGDSAWARCPAFGSLLEVPPDLGGYYASEVTAAIRSELLASQRRILELVERLSIAED